MSYAANQQEQPDTTSESRGQKVSSVHAAPKNENPGIVPSDSLAAESIQEGGSFAANSDARGVNAGKSEGLTANTTDTSAASVIDRANESSERGAGGETGIGGSALDEKSSGRGPTYNVAPGYSSSGGSGESGGSSGQTSGGSSSGANYGASSGGSTDNTVDPIYQSETGGNVLPESVAGGPKGSNITEGGFDADAPHAKFNVEPGSKEDVGRLKLDPQLPTSGGGAGGTQREVTGDGQFDVLRDASA